jgi:acyl-CoA thioester hydrolase
MTAELSVSQPSRRCGSNRELKELHQMASTRHHDFSVAVLAEDIDFMGHVNNAAYLKWVQEAVISHWQLVAPADAVAAYAWIAVKHEITYRRPAFLGDNVIVSVELEKVQRESAFYETVVRRGDEILADVKSRWCCLDAASLRPARLASAIVEHFMSGEN